MMLNATDKKIIKALTTIVADLLEAAQADPARARKYTQARTRIEQAMKLIGEGIRRTERPPSIGLPVHQKAENPPPKFEEEPPYALADNLEQPEQKQKRRRNAKNDNSSSFGDKL